MKTYHQSMDELHFTPEEKETMTERLLKASQTPVHRVRPLRRMAAVGVAAALVLTVGVGAAATGVLKSAGEAFSEVFGGAPAQTEIIDRIGRPVGASDTADGVVITADAIVGDRYSYAIVYTIAREDGKPLAEDLTPNAFGYLPLRFESADVDVGQQGGSHGASYFFDADPEDNAVQYVDLRTGDTPLTPGTARASFRNLSVYTDNDYTKSTPVAQGKWKMRFAFQFEDTSVSLPAGQSFLLNGMEATLDSVVLSPLSFQVSYTVQQEVQWDNAGGNGQQSAHDREESLRYLESLPVVLTKRDGTTIDLTSSGGSISPEAGKTVCQKSDIFSSVLSLEEIESITVADLTFPLTQGE